MNKKEKEDLPGCRLYCNNKKCFALNRKMNKKLNRFCSIKEVCKNDDGECDSSKGCDDFERK